MRFKECLTLSFKSLASNKTRAALTMLGIIIGVGAVITMLAIGTGATRKLQQGISNGGSNLLTVMPGSVKQRGQSLVSGESSLTLKDSQAIARECSGVLLCAPMTCQGCQAVFGNRNWATSIHATTPAIMAIRNARIVAGRNLSEQDVRNAAKVCVLGQTVADKLFDGRDPVGEVIRLKTVPFRVVGIKEVKGQSWEGYDLDDLVIVPTTTAQKRLFKGVKPGTVGWINVKAANDQAVNQAEAQITGLLRQRHRIASGQEADFRVLVASRLRRTATESTRIMTLLLSSIASVSLIVGGVGIMNIMLVSVTERTREIGIRMAVGAKAHDIRLQFLIEALVLSLLGGLLGIILGALGTLLISHFAGWPVAISLGSVMLAVGFAALIGVFFGYYPAYQASRLRPIEALRYE